MRHKVLEQLIRAKDAMPAICRDPHRTETVGEYLFYLDSLPFSSDGFFYDPDFFAEDDAE